MESPFNQIALRSPFFDTGLSAFTPLSLFSASEPGAWYDPSDMSTMFQDANGNTAVTAVEQPVSLILDKSKSLALGSELVTNGDFSSGSTGWSVGANTVISGGNAVSTGTPIGSNILQQGLQPGAGKRVRIQLTVTNWTGGNIQIFINNNSVIVSGQNGLITVYVTSTDASGSGFLLRASGSAFSGTLDNISVKEIAGNHAYTPSTATASRPVLSARYNLLTKTEQFNDAVWIKSVATVSANTTATTDPLGGNTADKLIETAASGLHTAYTTFSQISGTTYKASVYAKAAERNFLLLYTESNTGVWFDLSTGSVGTTQANAISPTITNVGNGWYQCSFSWVAVATSLTVAFNTVIASANNTTSYTGNGTSGIYIWGADLRVANDGVSIPTYQRVNTSTDYDTTNFPMYLRFDGSDDYMLTGTITPGTDKAQVFAGVRKLSDAALGIVAELSVTSGDNNGTFTLYAPYTPPTSFGFRSKGTTLVDAITGSNSDVAPTTKVQTGIGDISGDISRLRLNGTQINQNTSDQGTGNYLAYPLYIGRRGGTASPFNGRLFGLIVRFGANLDNTQITNTETWMNGKTKAY